MQTRSLLIALALVATLLPAAPAGAELSRAWTFEQPAFGRPSLWVTDHCFLAADGTWHLFYTHRYTAEEPYRGIGHASSVDRRHWTEHAPAMQVQGGDPSWRASDLWAPHVAAWPGGGWVMAVTGVNVYDSQQTGFFWSDDLETWEERSEYPPVVPDGSRYFWSPTLENDNRDPHLYFDGSLWHLLYAIRTHAGVSVVGYSSSPDLVAWTHHDPLLSAGGPWQLPDLESPGLVEHGGWLHLYYSYLGVRTVRALDIGGPWEHSASQVLDAIASGGEVVPSADGLFLSRIRVSSCSPQRPVLWFDSLDTSGWPYARVPLASMNEFHPFAGTAFLSLPQFGDPQVLRGEPPVDESGLYWLSSRESGWEPSSIAPCSQDRGSIVKGEIRSDPFPLDADTVCARVLSGAPTESLFVSLRDACTLAEIARFHPSTPSLRADSTVVTSMRGHQAQWRIVDAASGSGGWIGVDQLELRHAAGALPLPPGPVLAWDEPDGGENYTGSSVRLRWTGSHPAGIDSFVVYASYDGGESLVWLQQRSGSSTSWRWYFPVPFAVDVRVRLVAYGSDGVVSCLDSQPFHIGAAVDAPAPSPLPPLRVQWANGQIYLYGTVPGSPDTPAYLEIFDVRGRRIAAPWRGLGGESYRVPVPRADVFGRRLGRGLYFARLRHGESVWTARVPLF